MSAKILYGCADVAQLLRVTNAAVSNYRTRYSDAPEPPFTTTDGRPFWDESGMRAWQRWQENLRENSRQAKARSSHDAVEALRTKLGK